MEDDGEAVVEEFKLEMSNISYEYNKKVKEVFLPLGDSLRILNNLPYFHSHRRSIIRCWKVRLRQILDITQTLLTFLASSDPVGSLWSWNEVGC